MLPIDGRPVVVALLHELAQRGSRGDCRHGYRRRSRTAAEAFPSTCFLCGNLARRSADAVRRGLHSVPAIVVAADTVLFTPVRRQRFPRRGSRTSGAPPAATGPPHRRRCGRGRPHTRRSMATRRTPSAASTLALGEDFVLPAGRLRVPPYELADAFSTADRRGGPRPCGRNRPTRDLTHPQDLSSRTSPIER